MSKVFIGLDIGGTKLVAVAADETGKVIRKMRGVTPVGLEEGLARLDEMIGKVAEGDEIVGIGAGAGGPLNWETGVVSPLHQPEWRGIRLKERMEGKYGCGFAVDVDTNVAALAEYYWEDVRPVKLLYVTLSTGMGGGLIINGEIYRGMNGEHPEVGHQTVPWRAAGLTHAGAPRKVECPCGSEGCLEALVSGNGIRRVYGKGPEELGAREWEEVAWNLGQGLRNMAVIYLPDVMVLGGGVIAGAGTQLVGPAVRVMREHLKIVPHPRVRVSEMGDGNVAAGAVRLGMGDLNRR